MSSSVVELIIVIKNILLVIFNLGIIARTMKLFIDGMTDENGLNKKKLINLVKVLIVINSVGVFVSLMQHYFEESISIV